MRELSPTAVALEGDFDHLDLHTRGIRLHAVVAGKPTDPLIIFLHDSFTCWVDFAHILPSVAAQGFYAVALDMRGYGMSDKPPTGHDLRHLTGDLSGAIRTLGHDKAHIVGMGTGATIAWTLATSHPNHVKSITTCGAIHPTDMRKLVMRQPWLFSNLVATSALFMLPSSVVAKMWRHKKPLIRRDLRNNTSLDFQCSEQFTQNLRWRETTASIASSTVAIIRSSRVFLAVAPPKWAAATVDVPVHMLIDNSHQSAALVPAARSRATLGIRTQVIPGTRLRPHLENPKDFISAITAFAHAIESKADHAS
ncbi:MAG: alpha/beta hydrolase [Corynebacterium sp.]|uniref:alpha/beta hydrolase n=1 Tax=Corynebacterium sp. TaxID=1720 RepID=UPI0026DA70AF|nr:alpha/beta hydrolase [Corynebacterium sp.]MDO4761942.1 alpha/beta hydrolase [Corynebacterium sp.]